jgi:hypothetical protein
MPLSNNRINFASNPYGDTGAMGNILFSAPEKAQPPKPRIPRLESSIGNTLTTAQLEASGKLIKKKVEDPVFGSQRSSSEINEETGKKLLGEATNTLTQTASTKEGRELLKKGLDLLKPSVTPFAGATSAASVASLANPVVSSGVQSAIAQGANLSKAANVIKTVEPLAKSVVPAADAGMKAVQLGSKAASTATTAASTTASTATSATGGALSGIGAIGSLGLSLGTGLLGTGISMWGSNQEEKSLNRADLKGYGWSQAAKYGGMGLSLGSTVGSFFGPVGTLIGGGIGAGLGAIGGGIYGYFNKKKILRERSEEQQKVDAANKRIKEENYVTMTQYRDQLKQKNFMDQVNNLENAMAYKRGGILLKYANVSDAIIIEETIEPKKLINVPIFKMGGEITSAEESYVNFEALTDEDKDKYLQAVYELSQKGEDLVSISKKTKLAPKTVESIQQYFAKMMEEQSQQAATPEYKKGGKVMLKKKVQACNCGCTPKFKRGGTLDLQKEHVIINGPSHDEYNKTGVKGDRGLPVVKMTKGGQAIKVAEIESDELVLGKSASDKLRKLKSDLSKHSDVNSPEHNKIKEDIAELLHKELANNTYDYSNLMS